MLSPDGAIITFFGPSTPSGAKSPPTTARTAGPSSCGHPFHRRQARKSSSLRHDTTAPASPQPSSIPWDQKRVGNATRSGGRSRRSIANRLGNRAGSTCIVGLAIAPSIHLTLSASGRTVVQFPVRRWTILIAVANPGISNRAPDPVGNTVATAPGKKRLKTNLCGKNCFPKS